MKGEGHSLRLISVAAGLATLWVVGGSGLRSLDADFKDRIVRAKARSAAIERVPVAILAIDDESIAELGRFPWSRGVLARGVERLAEAGAAVVALDILLTEPADAAGDSALASAIAGAGNVVLASAVALPDPEAGDALLGTPLPSGRVILAPIPLFADAAAGVGSITVAADPDGVLRRYPFVVPTPSGAYPSLAYVALEQLQPSEPVQAPLDDSGRLTLNWAAAAPGSMSTLSFAELLRGELPALRRLLSGKVVLVAATYTGGGDVGPTPVGNRTPLAYTHAYALQTVLSGRLLREAPGWLPLLLALSLLAVLSQPAVAGHPTVVGVVVPTVLLLLLAGSWALLRFGSIYLPPAFPAAAVLLFGGVHGLLAWRHHLEGRQRAEAFLRRFVGSKMERRMALSPDLSSHSQRTEVTILFFDLCDFTSFANTADSDVVVDVLRAFGTCAIDIITERGGVVDKILGDGVMAFWGFPEHPRDHAARAVEAALAIQRDMPRVNALLAEEGIRNFQARIGLATGYVTIGEIGSDTLADFTLVGRYVNLAARLQDAAPPGGVLISDVTFRRAGGAVGPWVARQEPTEVKGFDERIDTYLVWPEAPESTVQPYRSF